MMNFSQDIEFTGIVVTYNEQRHLLECLRSLAFCEQLLVIDLGSTDSSIDIAEECGAEIIYHERVPIVEQIRNHAKTHAKNDWIVFLDPDEVLPIGIQNEIRSVIARDPNLGAIKIPMRYYFMGKRLDCTRWGIEHRIVRVCNKGRIKFSSSIFNGSEVLEGYHSVVLENQSPNSFIKHYWVDSYQEMFAKHWRYLKHEGVARYNAGQRFSWRFTLRNTCSALKQNIIDYQGYRCGFIGFFLSFFYSWFIFMSNFSVRRYQRSISHSKEQ